MWAISRLFSCLLALVIVLTHLPSESAAETTPPHSQEQIPADEPDPDAAPDHQDSQEDEVPDSNLDKSYVAAIRFNGKNLPDFYDLAEGEDGALFLPAEAIFQFGEASVSSEPGRMTLAVASLERSLTVDSVQGILEIDGRQQPLQPHDFRALNSTILVSAKLLAEVFQLESSFQSSTQELIVKSGRPFPRDLRVARERQWDRLNTTEALTVPVRQQVQEYGLIGSPQADFSLSGQAGSDSDLTSTWSALVVSEGLYLTNNLFFSGDLADPFDSLRLRSGRMAPNGNVFGVKPLHDVQFGDISGQRIPLVGGGGSGRGIRLQASPLGRATNFDTTLIEGDAPPGWDAELYRGSTLVNVQRIESDGRYRFDDIPLDYGMNEIKVILYGPQGQVREEIHREQIGAAMVPPGEIYSSAYMIQDGTQLFQVGDTSQASTSDLVLGGVAVDYGVASWLTVGVFAARSKISSSSPSQTDSDVFDQVIDDYFGLELRPMLGSIGFEAGAAGRGLGGNAAYGRFIVPVFSTSISVSHYQFDDLFASQENEDGQLASKSALRFGIPLGPQDWQFGTIGVSLEDQQHRENVSEQTATLTYGHRLGPINLGHEAELNWDGQDEGQSGYDGLYTLRSSYRHDLFDFRGTMTYGLGDDSRLESIALTGLWRKNDYDRLYASLAHSPEDGTNSYSVGWSHDLGVAALTVSASAADNGPFFFGLGLNFSFGHTPTRGFNMDSRARASMGLADVHVFEDVNADGLFTPGQDKPMPGAGILVNRRPLENAAADAEGRIGLDSLSIYGPLEIGVNTGSLSDEFLVPVFPAVQTWPRPGQAIEVNIPVTESGEISGSVKIEKYFKDRRLNENGDKAEKGRFIEQPVSGIRMQALNAEGQLHAEAFTMKDGYFSFENVYPGRWFIQVAPGQKIGDIALGEAEPEAKTEAPFRRDRQAVEVILTRTDSQRHDLELLFDDQGTLKSSPAETPLPPHQDIK